MPFLSAILSIVAVGALTTYGYLNYSKKIEDAKKKIVEVQRVENATKKIFFKKTAESRINVEQNNSKLLLKLSDLAVQDGTLTQKDLKLLNQLQNAVEKLSTNIQNPTCEDLKKTGKISLKDCQYISKKEIKYYKQGIDGELINNDSVIKNTDLRKDVAIWSKNKNKRYLEKDLFDNSKKAKIIKSTKDPDVALLVLKSEEDSDESSLGRKKLYDTLDKVAQNFSDDRKAKIKTILEKKRKKFITFRDKIKNKEKQREKEILLGRLNRMMMYYQKKILYKYNTKRKQYLEILKYNQEIDRKLALLEENYKKEKAKIENSKELRKGIFFFFFSNNENLIKSKLEKIKKDYDLKKEQLLSSKKSVAKIDLNSKKTDILKLNKCYYAQKSKPYPDLSQFKNCSLNIF